MEEASIGMPMLIRDVMVKDVLQVPDSKSITETGKILKSKGIGCIVVTGGGKIKGIVTERDIIHKVIAPSLDPSKTQVKDIMTGQVITLGPANTIDEAVDLMNRMKIKKLPIVENGKLVGIVTMTDLIRILRSIEKGMLSVFKKKYLSSFKKR